MSFLRRLKPAARLSVQLLQLHRRGARAGDITPDRAPLHHAIFSQT